MGEERHSGREPRSNAVRVVCYGISPYESNAMKSPNPRSGIYVAETSRTLDFNGGNPSCNQGGIMVLVYESHGQDCRYRPLGDVCSTVSQKYGTGGGNQPIVLMYEEDSSKHGQWATAQHGDGRTGESSGLYARCPSNPNQREREREYGR